MCTLGNNFNCARVKKRKMAASGRSGPSNRVSRETVPTPVELLVEAPMAKLTIDLQEDYQFSRTVAEEKVATVDK